eukprot:Rhum_TRINITY_DN13648_c2_g1::Rhum_TRINITY_DN13648_c2_g1_i1::g.61959::m.61959
MAIAFFFIYVDIFLFVCWCCCCCCCLLFLELVSRALRLARLGAAGHAARDDKEESDEGNEGEQDGADDGRLLARRQVVVVPPGTGAVLALALHRRPLLGAEGDAVDVVPHVAGLALQGLAVGRVRGDVERGDGALAAALLGDREEGVEVVLVVQAELAVLLLVLRVRRGGDDRVVELVRAVDVRQVGEGHVDRAVEDDRRDVVAEVAARGVDCAHRAERRRHNLLHELALRRAVQDAVRPLVDDVERHRHEARRRRLAHTAHAHARHRAGGHRERVELGGADALLGLPVAQRVAVAEAAAVGGVLALAREEQLRRHVKDGSRGRRRHRQQHKRPHRNNQPFLPMKYRYCS